MKRVAVIQHMDCETPGAIGEALKARGLALSVTHSYHGDKVPESMNPYEALVVMGGPMGVYEADRYPYLKAEMRLIEKALKAQKPVLGVCLGSQLLSQVLGSPVRKGGYKEIGWYPLILEPEARKDALWSPCVEPLDVFLWHGDVFDLPRDSVNLARTERTACQAFRYGVNAYGFLFHIEVNPSMIRGMLEAFDKEIQAEHLNSEEIIKSGHSRTAKLESIAQGVFGRWVDLIEAAQPKESLYG